MWTMWTLWTAYTKYELWTPWSWTREDNVIVKWEVTALTWDTEPTSSLVQTTLTTIILHRARLERMKIKELQRKQ